MMKIMIAITTQATTKVLVDIESSPTGYLIERSEQKNPRRNGVKCFFLNNTNNMIRIRKLATFNNIDVSCEVNLFNIVLGTPSFSHSLDSEIELFFLTLFISVELLRVSDYKHHLVDVIVGYVIGGVIGAIASIHASGWDKIAIQQNFADKQNSNGSPSSIQEQVELNEANGHYKNKDNKEGDIEKVMEIEGGFHAANVNITRQNTTMTTESEISVE